MRLNGIVAVLGLALVGLCLPAGATDKESSKSDALVGTWTGTWTGGSAGHLDLTLARGADGTFSGSVSVMREDGTGYAASFDAVTVDGASFVATFKVPDISAAITLRGALEKDALKGTYAVQETENGTDVETGTWTATKKS